MIFALLALLISVASAQPYCAVCYDGTGCPANVDFQNTLAENDECLGFACGADILSIDVSVGSTRFFEVDDCSGTPATLASLDSCTNFGAHSILVNSSGACDICGDGFVVGTEECDDGNMVDDDGCSSCECDLEQITISLADDVAFCSVNNTVSIVVNITGVNTVVFAVNCSGGGDAHCNASIPSTEQYIQCSCEHVVSQSDFDSEPFFTPTINVFTDHAIEECSQGIFTSFVAAEAALVECVDNVNCTMDMCTPRDTCTMMCDATYENCTMGTSTTECDDAYSSCLLGCPAGAICQFYPNASEFCDSGEICDTSLDCQADCNMNNIADIVDVANMTSEDINNDTIPDECQLGACCLPPLINIGEESGEMVDVEAYTSYNSDYTFAGRFNNPFLGLIKKILRVLFIGRCEENYTAENCTSAGGNWSGPGFTCEDIDCVRCQDLDTTGDVCVIYEAEMLSEEDSGDFNYTPLIVTLSILGVLIIAGIIFAVARRNQGVMGVSDNIGMTSLHYELVKDQ